MLPRATLTAAAAATATILMASPAHADTTQFLKDVQSAGFTDGSFGATGLEEAGTFICAQLDQGEAPGTVAQTENLMMTNLTPYEVGEFFAISVGDLCPQHNAEVEQWASSVT
jgi:hypothetical protein